MPIARSPESQSSSLYGKEEESVALLSLKAPFNRSAIGSACWGHALAWVGPGPALEVTIGTFKLTLQEAHTQLLLIALGATVPSTSMSHLFSCYSGLMSKVRH